MQRELNADLDLHPGRTAEEVYAERIRTITLAMNPDQDGRTVLNGLLARCLLWVEIVEEKYVVHLQFRHQSLLTTLTDEDTLTNASRTPLTNSSRFAMPSIR